MIQQALGMIIFFIGRDFQMEVSDHFDLNGYLLCPQDTSSVGSMTSITMNLEDLLLSNKQSSFGSNLLHLEIDELLLCRGSCTFSQR